MRRTAPASKGRPVVLLLLKLLLALGAVTVAACSFVLLAMKWHWPAVVDVSLTANRVSFDAKGINSAEAPVLGEFAAESLTVSSFENIRLYPSKIEVADPAQFDLESGVFKESAWKAISLNGSDVTIQAGDRLVNPSVTVTGGNSKGRDLLSIYPMLVKSNSNVVLQTPITHDAKVKTPSSTKEPSQPTELRVTLRSPDPYQDVLIHESILLNVRHCILKGLENPFLKNQSVSLRLSLQKNRSAMHIRGLSNSLALVFMVPHHQAGNVFPRTGFTMLNPEFLREASPTKGTETSLVAGAEGALTYRDYPKIPKITFKFPEALRFDGGDEFALKEMRLEPDVQGVFLNLTGKTKKVAIGVAGLDQNEHYVTVLTVLQQNPVVLALLGIVGWLVPTALSIRKFVKELGAELDANKESAHGTVKKPGVQSAGRNRRRK